jgi:single-stranded-DNA-specific exonuclease RecJ
MPPDEFFPEPDPALDARMHRTKRWNIAEPHPAAEDLAARLKLSPLLAQLLLNRGISDPTDCQNFLRPSLKLLPDPFTLPGLRQAAERIAKAIRDKEKIVIYGDYDVDGITATSILWHAIRVLGGTCDFYIPHRIEEGYGLNAEALTQLCDQGAQLIITVDCGITAIEPAALAKCRNVDLIITDHHEWHESHTDAETRGHGDAEKDPAVPPLPSGEASGTGDCPRAGRGEGESRATPNRDGSPDSALSIQPSALIPASQRPRIPASPLLPNAHTLVHPRLPSDGAPYANPHLCGAGVAFKLAWGIGLAMSGSARVTPEFRDYLIEATALAALGTIADVVPLVGENRLLAHFGLTGLKASKITGIQALIANAGLTGQKLDSVHVGFLLAPRLNASGRMGHARLAVEMLTTADTEKSNEIASYLEQQNRQRQSIERKILDQALAQIESANWHADDKCAIVLGDETWHPGVIGIVASRIVDRFHRPAIMVALNNGHGQGSGRSIAGFHLARALENCADHLEAFGGHEMAAGLKVQTAKFEDFRRHFCDHASKLVTPEMMVPEMVLEATAQLHHLCPALVTDLARLGPFGHGNRKPLFCFRDLEVSSPPRRVGKTGDHLQLHLRAGGHFIKAIAFGQGQLFDHLKVGTKLDIAAEPLLNHYNGYTTVELEIKDFQFPTLANT